MKVAPPPGVSATATDVVEGGSVNLSATDFWGHRLYFVWTTSCGSLTSYLGWNTTFNAGDNGGRTCGITAILNGSRSTVQINVVQDTSSITVDPTFAVIIEGFTYFNIHTALHQTGEIRGDIVRVVPAPAALLVVALGAGMALARRRLG